MNSIYSNFFALCSMAFFLPSSTSTSTTTSLSSSPLPVLRQLDSEEEDESRQSHDGNGSSSLRHRRSHDSPSTQSGFTMFGLLSRRIEYISGASASDISSLESSSESEVESWTRRAGGDEDEFDDDDRHATNTRRRTSRSTRDASNPSGHGRSPGNINNNNQAHDDRPVVELSVGTSRSHGATQAARAITTATDQHHTGQPSTTTTIEPNVVVVASSANQVEGEETVKRRRDRTGEVDRSRYRRVKVRSRRRDSHVYEAFICKYSCCFFNLFKLLSTWGCRFMNFF